MNLDDPIDFDAVKPPAKMSRTAGKFFCEYCGQKGHTTKRSTKCTAKDSLVKKFRKEDGALLSDNPPEMEPASTSEVASSSCLCC
jgi:hypothetical protein